MLKNNLKTIRMGEFFLSKRDFSKKLDIAEQQYLRYESGQSNPSLEIAIKISIKLNKHVDDIWYIDKIWLVSYFLKSFSVIIWLKCILYIVRQITGGNNMHKLLLNTINEIESKITKNKIPPKFKKIASFLIGVIKIIDLFIAITYRLIILLIFVSIVVSIILTTFYSLLS